MNNIHISSPLTFIGENNDNRYAETFSQYLSFHGIKMQIPQIYHIVYTMEYVCDFRLVAPLAFGLVLVYYKSSNSLLLVFPLFSKAAKRTFSEKVYALQAVHRSVCLVYLYICNLCNWQRDI